MLAKYNISMGCVDISTTDKQGKIVQKEAQEILPFLPPQTKFHSWKLLPVTKLCVDFELFFEHQWFLKDTIIEAVWSREIYRSNGELIEFNLLRKIEYTS